MPAMWPSSVRSALAMGYAILFTIFTCNAGSVLAAVRQAPSSEPFYVAPNGVTVMCPGVAVGDTFTLNDVTFTKVDSATLTSLANDKGSWPQLATSCTTGVTTMANLFYRKKSFNEDISSWDTSSVKTLFKLFWVRAKHAPRRLWFRCRCFLAVYPSLQASTLTSHGHPSLVAL
jgi:surface protein